MKIKSIYIVLVLIILMSFNILLISCIKGNESKTSTDDKKRNNTKNSTDKIQLWYGSEVIQPNETIIENITRNAQYFCEINNIPLEIVKFDKEILTYDDYVFKRNLAAENGNMIILDDISALSELAKSHADYTKINAYNDLLSPYKNRFCIPIGRISKSAFFDNEILKYYNVDIPERPVITYTDLLEIKQELKKRGAKFEPKTEDMYETVKYHLNKNGLQYLNLQDEILRDNNRLKAAIKKSVYDICEDIIIYNNADLDGFNSSFRITNHGIELIDSNSNLYLKKSEKYIGLNTATIYPSWFIEAGVKDCSNKTFIIDYYGTNTSIAGRTTSLFIYKKITNEKIYDLASYLLERSNCIFNANYRYNDKAIFIPIFYTQKVINKLKLNENLEYIGEKVKSIEKTNEDEKKIINATFDIFAKDEFKSKEIADAYFANSDIVRYIEDLIYKTIYEIAQNLSDSNSEDTLSLEGFNREDKEINKLVDKKIDEFIKQLILLIN